MSGFPSPLGVVASAAGGAVSGSTDIFGSMFGGGTAERGSGLVSGRRSIPGSIFDGGMAGVGCSEGLSGISPDLGADPFSGMCRGGSTSAALSAGSARSKNKPARGRIIVMRHYGWA